MTLSDAEKRHIQRMENSIAAMTPTQEQIEAAAEKIWEDFCGRIGGDWKYLGDNAVVKNQCKATAKAALEAAAGVGEKPQATFPHGTLLVNATIEDCAKVAEEKLKEHDGPYGCGPYTRNAILSIIDAIRARKKG